MNEIKNESDSFIAVVITGIDRDTARLVSTATYVVSPGDGIGSTTCSSGLTGQATIHFLTLDGIAESFPLECNDDFSVSSSGGGIAVKRLDEDEEYFLDSLASLFIFVLLFVYGGPAFAAFLIILVSYLIYINYVSKIDMPRALKITNAAWKFLAVLSLATLVIAIALFSLEPESELDRKSAQIQKTAVEQFQGFIKDNSNVE